jgi:hypothetical protein
MASRTPQDMTRFIVLAYCESAQETEVVLIEASSATTAEERVAAELGEDWCVLGSYLPAAIRSIANDAETTAVAANGGSTCLDTLVSA